MIKVTLEVDGVKSTIRHKDGSNIQDVLNVFDGALRGCGFFYTGILTIEDEENG